MSSKSVASQSGAVKHKHYQLNISRMNNVGFELNFVEPIATNGGTMDKNEKEDVQSEVDYWSSLVMCHILGANPPLAVMQGLIRRIWENYEWIKSS